MSSEPPRGTGPTFIHLPLRYKCFISGGANPDRRPTVFRQYSWRRCIFPHLSDNYLHTIRCGLIPGLVRELGHQTFGWWKITMSLYMGRLPGCSGSCVLMSASWMVLIHFFFTWLFHFRGRGPSESSRPLRSPRLLRSSRSPRSLRPGWSLRSSRPSRSARSDRSDLSCRRARSS